MLQESKPSHNGEGMGYVNFREGGMGKKTWRFVPGCFLVDVALLDFFFETTVG